MKRDQINPAGWPKFDSRLLQEVVSAFFRRSKSIRYLAGLSCSREFNETSEGASERLNLDLEPGSGDLRLSVWEDGSMWLRLCVADPGRNSGWAFMDCFRGDIQDVSPEALVVMLEATIAEPFRPGSTDPSAYRDDLRTIWKRVRPRAD